MTRAIEAVLGLAMARLLIGRVTGESLTGWVSPLVDWRWLLAVPAAFLLALMVEVVVNPDALE